MHRHSLAVVLLLAGSGSRAAADTIHVPKEHKSIQAAIDAAEPGDTVLVAAGTYRERIRLKGGVALKSAGDDAQGKLGLKRAEATIIDGGGREGEGPGVAMAEGSSLDGFTVTKGPPQFAVWGLPGSDIFFTGNTVRGWRHALVAEKSAVKACDDRGANYGQVGIKIDQPIGKVVAVGNIFESDRDRAGVSISGGDGILENNRIEKPKPADAAGQRNDGAMLRPGDFNQAGSPR